MTLDEFGMPTKAGGSTPVPVAQATLGQIINNKFVSLVFDGTSASAGQSQSFANVYSYNLIPDATDSQLTVTYRAGMTTKRSTGQSVDISGTYTLTAGGTGYDRIWYKMIGSYYIYLLHFYLDSQSYWAFTYNTKAPTDTDVIQDQDGTVQTDDTGATNPYDGYFSAVTIVKSGN